MNSEAKIRLLVHELYDALGREKADRESKEDIERFSLMYSLQLMEMLQPLGVNVAIHTGWLSNGKDCNRTCYSYLKIILENGKKLYINTLNSVGSIDKNIIHGLKRYKK